MGETQRYEYTVVSGETIEFIKGIGVGAAVAAPVGPMSLLCMRRTLAQGWRLGFATGTGIAAADALYALVAALGLASVMHFMSAYERPLHLAAGAFLIYLGWRTVFFHAPQSERASTTASATAAFAGALLLTLTNPPTIVSFAAMFAVLVPTSFDTVGALSTATGVFAGSLLWWLGLTGVVARVRHALGPRARLWLERISGGLLGALGVAEIRRAA